MTVASVARRLWLWAPPVAYLGVIFHLSGQPQVPWAAPYPDQLLHAAEYGLLAVLLARALNRGLSRRLTWGGLAISWTLCLLYGASDEFHQYFVPGRSADYRDVLSDAVGAALALLGLLVLQRVLRIAEAADPNGGARAVLYRRAGCGPCFTMQRAAGRAARRRGVPLVVVDVDSDPALLRLHGNEVPVLELPGGRQLRGRASADEVDRAFLEAARSARAGADAPIGWEPGRGVARAIAWIKRLLGARV